MRRLLFFSVLIFPLTHWGQLSITTYSVGDGLAQSQVYAMLEDSRGYIWMGTRGGGISRFDGQKFKTFSTQHNLINNYISALYEDKSGNIWIGTNDGISIYNGINFENIRINDSLNMRVSCFQRDAIGNLWIGTSEGIYLYKDGVFENWSRIKEKLFGKYIYDLYEHIDGSIWACSDRGVLHMTKDTSLLYGRSQGLSHLSTRHIVGNETGVYVSTFGGGLNLFKEGKFSMVTNEVAKLNDMFLDEDVIWLTSHEKGILKYNLKTKQSKSITVEDGLSNNHTRMIMKDSWGNFWFATSGAGVNKYFGQEFEHITKEDWLGENYVYDVMTAQNGDIWTSYSTGLAMKNEDTIIYFNSSNGYSGGKARVLEEDHLGNIWIGTDGNSVFCYDGAVFKKFIRSDGIPNYWITDILQDELLNIWISTADGIVRLKPINPNEYLYEAKIWTSELNLGRKASVTDLEQDKLGRIWFGSRSNGVGYLLNDEITNFGTNSGLSEDQVKSLKVSPDGDLWIGTEGKGVKIASAQEGIITFDVINTESGLTSDNTYLIEFDQKGNAWVGSEKGVDRIQLGDNNIVKDKKHYGKEQGFKGVETTRNASSIDSEGNLWFGTINGLMKYNPEQSKKNLIAPNLSLTGISLFYKDLSEYEGINDKLGSWYLVNDQLTLKYDQNHISFNFKGINQKNPGGVKYQFQLEGFDPDWSPLATKNDATYSNLSPGNYNFKVKAVNEDNVWTNNPISFSFSITPPFWQTLWFLIGSIGIGILTLSLLITLRIRAIKKKVRLEKETVEMERSMLELEQKALRLQMNPHFIFNSLNSVQALILRKDQKSARYYLAKFSKLMRQTLENSRSQLISVRDEISALENYLELENFGREEPIEFIINIGENIDPDNVLIPAILLQPFAENAIIHGFKELERKPKLHVEFLLQDEILTCSISDNGNGREHAKKSKAQIEQQHKSAALEVTQERLSLLNQNEVKKGFEIIDLYDDGIAMGTKVVLRMKLNELF